MATELTYCITSFNSNYSDFDNFVIKMRENIFVEFEDNREKKTKNNKLIKIIDLPFGLWQCHSCGYVNILFSWPYCRNC